MKTKILFTIQIILGIALIFFGLDKFLHFMPHQASQPEMGIFMKALVDTEYMMPLVGAIQFLSGVAFALNRYVAFMAILIMPVMLNALLIHLFLDPEGSMASSIVTLFIVLVMYKHKDAYTLLFKETLEEKKVVI